MTQGGYNLQPRRPPWGIRPPTHRELSAKQPILAPLIPSEVAIPSQQSLGEATHATVVADQMMQVGEPIAQTDSETGLNVHASVSGRGIAVEDRPIPAPLARCKS